MVVARDEYLNTDMRKEKNQSALEKEAETLVSIFLPAERTYLATVPQLTPEVVEELLACTFHGSCSWQ